MYQWFQKDSTHAAVSASHLIPYELVFWGGVAFGATRTLWKTSATPHNDAEQRVPDGLPMEGKEVVGCYYGLHVHSNLGE